MSLGRTSCNTGSLKYSRFNTSLRGLGSIQKRMPDFFLTTDIWLTQSVGLSVGTIIDSGLGFDCISSSFRKGARTTHYWGGSILNGKVDLLTREYACCVLEGNRELLNVVVRSCRNAIKMISAQHSSNNGKNWQKLSYQKILLAW